MAFYVRIIDGQVHYEPVAGTTTGWVRSAKHHLPVGYAVGVANPTFAGPNSKYLKLTVPKVVTDLVLRCAASSASRSTKKPKGAASRSDWIAANPGLGLFKEIFHELRVYHEGGALSCEVVGPYRYLYKLNLGHYDPAGYGASMRNPRIDTILMYYLQAAAAGTPA